MNNIIHIIHPKDKSTDFLEEIYFYLKENTNVVINLIRLDNREDHMNLFNIIPQIPNHELIIFFGHGTSKGLSGANTINYQYLEFISEQQLNIFRKKNVVLLSCRSNQYLKNYFKECNLNAAIGFPNLITDFEELEYPDDYLEVKDITKENINLFRTVLVDVFKYSLEDFIMTNLSLFELFNRMKLRINKRLIKFYRETPNKGVLPFGKMLNDLIDDMDYFGKLSCEN